MKKFTYTDKSTIADFTNGGIIDKVVLYKKNEQTKLKIRFRKSRKPAMGDKFASRHGQKGVIGMILPQEDMPFSKDGIVPDIIMNPHAFPKRMNIGHLMESVFTKYACLSGNILDGTVFENNDMDGYCHLLDKRGFQKHGNELLYNGYTGEQINTDIFIGPTYYYRLKHMVNDKINYRGGNDPSKMPITGTTRQPTQGRANKGGLRIGEMETNAIIAHGLGSFIKESMLERSDKYKMHIDTDTGTLAIPHVNGPYSAYDKDYNKNIAQIETPYSFKLMIQEINALGVKVDLKVNGGSTDDDIEAFIDD
jgi:DNA-directed RNA polymerase beta subunit